jgi:hypothetical protein
MMTAVVVPSPITRRRDFIAKQASHSGLMHPDARVRYVLHHLDVQPETMCRRGIAEDLIQRELCCVRRAIRARFAGNVQHPGGEP